MTSFPAIGERFGPFLITGEIGHGGMGVVFAADQQPLNRPVALKVLDPRFSSDPEFVARFTREGELLAKLNSPHVIQVFDHGRIGDCLFLAMQRVSGGDLADYVREHGPLPTTLAADLAAQVASALADAHASGIIHRDIKPSNVLLARTGHDLFAYLCDFGIAQADQSGLTQTGMFPGSLAYTAPERHEGRPADVRSDIYSVGCLLWNLLSGRAPYSGTDFQIAQQHFSAPVPQVTGAGPVVAATNQVLGRLLAKDPGQRPQSAVEVVTALRWLQRVAETSDGVDDGSTRLRPTTSPAPGLAPGGQAVAHTTLAAAVRPGAGAQYPPLIESTVPRPSAVPPLQTHVFGTGAAPAVGAPGVGAPPPPAPPRPPAGSPKRGGSRTALVVVAVVVATALVGGGGLWALTSLFSAAPATLATPAVTSPAQDGGEPTASPTNRTRESVTKSTASINLGGNPHGIAVNPGSRLAFVANYSKSSVQVINLDSNTVVRKINVGKQPQSVAVDPATGLLLVGCDGIPAVQIYDLQGYHLVGSVSTGAGPIRIALHSSQKLAYVVAQGSSTMEVISLESKKLIRTVRVGADPRVIGVDERDQIAYVGHWNSSQITVLDLNAQSKIGDLEVGKDANSIEIAPDARVAFVANFGDGRDGGGSVSVIDLDTRAVKKTVNVDAGPSRVAVDEAAGVAYVTCLYADSVNVVSVADLTVTDRVRTANRPTGVGIDSSTGKLYVTSFEKHVVQVFAP